MKKSEQKTMIKNIETMIGRKLLKHEKQLFSLVPKKDNDRVILKRQ